MREDARVTDPFTPQPAPLYGEPLRRPPRNGIGTAALVLGCTSIFLGVLLFIPVLAVVFGIIGMRRARRGEATNHGIALAGTITGGVGLLFGIIGVIFVVRLFSSDAFSTFIDCDKAAVTTEQQNACARQFSDDFFGTNR